MERNLWNDKTYIYNELKGSLDRKYGTGQAFEHGIIYGNPEGRCIRLSVLTFPDEHGGICCLYYLDEKIYTEDTISAIDEL